MRTVLYPKHAALGAKMVDFAGWEMPLQYQGIIQEHLRVRAQAAIFDVSHMGRILVKGREAEKLLDYLSTNLIAGKPNLSATYTTWANPAGGCVDDLIVYKNNPSEFFLIVNASNRAKDLAHLQQYAKGYDVEIQDRYETDGILAIQGPKAASLVQRLFPEASSLAPMHFVPLTYKGEVFILSATGYTGAGGFEIYAPNSLITPLWDLFLKEGEAEGIQPAGLGARDTLRLEMGYALYGHELNETIAPSESVSAWTVRLKAHQFLGKEAIQRLQDDPKKRSEHGIILIDQGIAREGFLIYKNGQQIGRVTSGTYSPSLNKAIAIILVDTPLNQGDQVEVQIRQNRAAARVVKLPFWHNQKG